MVHLHSGTALIDPEAVFNEISLQKGMHVADLGCGRTGHFVFPAAKIVGEDGIVYAVEIMKDILESIESRIRSEGFGNIKTVWSDIESGKTPLPSNSLDFCFLVNVLSQVKNREAAINEAARLLSKNGSAVIIDWKKNLGGIGPSLKTMLKEDELLRIAGKAGLTLTKHVNIGDYHFCLILNKI